LRSETHFIKKLFFSFWCPPSPPCTQQHEE